MDYSKIPHRVLPDGAIAFVWEMSYGKGRINVTDPKCDLSIRISY